MRHGPKDEQIQGLLSMVEIHGRVGGEQAHGRRRNWESGKALWLGTKK